MRRRHALLVEFLGWTNCCGFVCLAHAVGRALPYKFDAANGKDPPFLLSLPEEHPRVSKTIVSK